MEKFLIFISVILTSLVKILSQEDLPEIQLDWLEKDKILTCAEFINRKFQQDNVYILFKIYRKSLRKCLLLLVPIKREQFLKLLEICTHFAIIKSMTRLSEM
jgi:hypothetical protein